MKLMNTPSDALGIDTRTRSAPRPAADNSSNDNNSPPFEGVLSDVGSDSRKSADTKDAPKTTDAPAPDATAPQDATAGATSGATSSGTTIIDALKGLLAEGAATSTDAKADPKGTTTDGSDAVDSLLKRMAAKDAATTDAQTAAAIPAAGTSPDMMSILLLGAAAQPAAAVAAAAAGVASAAGGALSAAIDPNAKSAANGKSTASDKAASADENEMAVTDIAVSTHLPPAQDVQNKALLANDAKTVVAQVVSLTSGGTHAHADDTAVAGHNAELSTSATTLTPAEMGLELGPTHSIANAITELAATAAPPAAATAEAAKPAIGIARTMTLQMNPAELGTVDIRLHITGQTLDVQLSISDTQTLGIVNRDRDTLASALHGQNYSLNSLVIQDGGASASSGGNNGHQGDTSGGNARADRQGGGTGADGQGGGRQGSGAERSAPEDRRPRRDAPARPSADTRGGSLYV